MRDKFLTEAMGGCWHENGFYDPTKCINCGEVSSNGCDIVEDQLDLSTWEGFGKLWEWAQGQEWWRDFWFSQPSTQYATLMAPPYCLEIIHPDRFADALHEYLKQK